MNLKEWWEKNGKPKQRDAEYLYKEQNKPCGHIPRDEFRYSLECFKYGSVPDKEIIEKNVTYKMQTQKYMDTNRIERKTFREFSRVSNALEEYNKNVINLLQNNNLNVTIKEHSLNNKAVGVIQLSDIHFNELIDIEGNKYDFEIASKRLKLLATKAKMYFKSVGISNVLTAMTGDLMNSDRRLDELLNQATNRAKATLLSFYILEQFIVDLNQDFNITVASVSGNESRANKEQGFSEICATDNYDFTLFNMLKVAFRDSKINFIDGSFAEQVVNVAGSNVLLLHGQAIKQDFEKTLQQIVGRYSAKGIKIDYIFFGHLHSARIGDLGARSSSLCGANAFSEFALDLSSRASQNIAIFYDNKSHDVFKVDLQSTEGIEGYEIIKELEAYNAKSVDKCKTNIPVFQVVI